MRTKGRPTTAAETTTLNDFVVLEFGTVLGSHKRLSTKSWITSLRIARCIGINPSRHPSDPGSHLVDDISFTPLYSARWVRTNGSKDSPCQFLVRIQSFTNARRMTLLENDDRFSSIPSFAGLPQSVTSLIIQAATIDIKRLRDVIMLLPDLANLSLSGMVFTRPGTSLPELRTVSRPRFGARLRLRRLDGADKDFVIRGSDRITLYRGMRSFSPRASPLDCETCRGVS